ncbi:MAG: YsnF/AvaK domain-containing protein [Phycisphaerae bacterium]
MKTIVGMFDNLSDANAAVSDLTNLGIRRQDISVITHKKDATDRTTTTDADADHKETHAAEGAGTGAGVGAVVGAGAGILASLGLLAIPGIGPLLAAGPIVTALAGAGVGAVSGGIVGGLIGLGIPEEDAAEYEEGVRRGGTVVTVRVDDAQAQQAADILDRHHAVNMQTRTQEWRKAGWTPKTASTGARSTAATSTPTTVSPNTTARPAARGTEIGEQRIPIVNETLSVGKREVDRGGVRLYSHVTEQPVTEDVRLRQERVSVERRPADRPATEEDLKTFKEGTVEIHERSEEAVVQKKAKVTGEVVVRKDVNEKTETVRDTVRRTDVKVDRLDADKSRSPAPSPTTTPKSNTGPSCNP